MFFLGRKPEKQGAEPAAKANFAEPEWLGLNLAHEENDILRHRWDIG
jgi:hypothetical protein